MEAVKVFNQELSGLYESKPPISRGKMTSLTKTAIKAIKLYKHVVQSVEKFIQKCRPEYKVPGLYVIDSIVRQSRHQFGREKDVFAPRFAKNINMTFSHLFKCLPEDKAKIVRVLNLWQKNSVFSAEIIQPLLDLANPENADSPDSPPPAAAVEKPEKKRAEPDWLKEPSSQVADNQHRKQTPSPQKKPRSHRHSHEDKTLALVSNLLMQAQEGSSEHQQLQQLQLIQETIQKQTKGHQSRPTSKETLKLDEAVLKQIQNLTKQLTSLASQGTAALSDTEEAEPDPPKGPSPPPKAVKEPPPPAAPQEKAETSFNSALLEFDYGDEEDDSPTKRKSPPPAAPISAPQENPPLPPHAPPERPSMAQPEEPEVHNLQASLEAVQKLADELNHAQSQQEQMQQFMDHQEQQIRHHLPHPGVPHPGVLHPGVPHPGIPHPGVPHTSASQQQPDQMHQMGHHMPLPGMIQPPPPMVPPQFYHQGPPPFPIPLPPMSQPPLPAAPPTSVPFTSAPSTVLVSDDQYQPEFPSEDVPTRISDSPIRETSDVAVVVVDSPPPPAVVETHRSRSRSPRKKRGRSRSRSRSRSPHSSSKRKHRSKRRHRSRSRSKERSRSRRSRSRDRSRDRSRSRRQEREEREEEQDDPDHKERKRGFPSVRENKASVCSLTIWMGRLPKSVSEREIKHLMEENGGGEIKSVHVVSARGCAYVLMTDRAEAAKVLDNLKYAKLHGSNIKVAWAPGVGVKDKKYKEYWDVDRGVSYIPWEIFSRHPEKLEELEEDSYVDIESLPEDLKKLRQPPEEEGPPSEEQTGSEAENQIPVHTGVPPPGGILTDPTGAPPTQQLTAQKDGSPPTAPDMSAPPPRFVGIPPGAPVMRMPVMPGGVMPPMMGLRLPPGMVMPPNSGVMTPPRLPTSTAADMQNIGEPEPPTSVTSVAPPPFMRPGMPLGAAQVLEAMRPQGSPTPHLIGQMPNRLLLPPRIAGLSLPVAPGTPENKVGGLDAFPEGKGLLGSPPGLPHGAMMLLENQRKANSQENPEQQPLELGGPKEEQDLEQIERPLPPVSLFGDLSQFAGPALRMVRPTLGQPMLPQGMLPGLVSIPRMVVPGGAMVRLPGQGIPVSLAGLRLAAPPGMIPPGGIPPGMLPPVPPEIMNLLRPPIPTIETPDEQPKEDGPNDVDDRVIPDYGATSPFQKEGTGEDMFDNGPPNQEMLKGDQDLRPKDSDLREPWPRPPAMPDFRGPPPPFRPEFPLRGPRPPWGPPFRGPPPRGMPPMGGPGCPPFIRPPPGEFGPPDGPPGGWGMDQDWRQGPLPSLMDQDLRGGHDQDWRPRPPGWGMDGGMGARPPFPDGLPMDQGMGPRPPFPDGPPMDQGMGPRPPFPNGPPDGGSGFDRDARNRDFDHRRERGGRSWDRNRDNERDSDRDRKPDRDERGSDRRDRSGDRGSDRGDRDHRKERDHDYRAKGRESEQGGQGRDSRRDSGRNDGDKRDGKENAGRKDGEGPPEKTKRKSRWAPVTNEAPPKPLLDIVIPPMKLKPHLTGPSPLAEKSKPPPMVQPPTSDSKPSTADSKPTIADSKPPVADSEPPADSGLLSPGKAPPSVDATTPVKDEKPTFDDKTPVGGDKGGAIVDKEPGNDGPVVAPSVEIKADGAPAEAGGEPPQAETGNNNVAKEVGPAEGLEEPKESGKDES